MRKSIQTFARNVEKHITVILPCQKMTTKPKYALYVEPVKRCKEVSPRSVPGDTFIPFIVQKTFTTSPMYMVWGASTS